MAAMIFYVPFFYRKPERARGSGHHPTSFRAAFRQKRAKNLADKGQTVAVQPHTWHHLNIDPSTVASQRVSG